MTGWVEYHVYLHDRAASDRFLTQALPGLVRAAGTNWWFIRYWMGGPHLRLRVPTEIGSPALADALAAAAAGYATGASLDRDAFYAHCGFDGAPVDPATLDWFADGTVRQIPYQPETDFYGTGQTLACNEALFCAASQLALRLISAAGGDRRQLAPVAADLLVATVAWLGAAREAPFVDAYRRFLMPFGPSSRGELAVPAHPGAPGAAWGRLLAGFEAPGEQPVRRFVLQHHLLLNRLGLSPRQEAGIFAALHREVVHG